LASETDKTVLIVDGETDFRSVLRDRLDQEGIRCLATGSTEQALQTLADAGGTVKVVVSEIELPDGTGLDLLEQIKQRCWRYPVIFLARCGRSQWVKKAIWAGAFEYFDKPVDLTALTQAIRAAMRAGAEYAGPERREPPGQNAAADISPNYRDQLTGVASHRGLMEMLPKLRRYCHQQDMPLGLCMLDIDGFRDLNTRRGFAMCDRILVEFTRRLRRLVRFNDIIGRYGGDEFVILLPGTDGADAHRLAERIIDVLNTDPLHVDGLSVPLPLCIGVVQLDPGDETAAMEFIDRATESVYYAKLRGSDKIVAWQPDLMQETMFWDIDNQKDGPVADVESINIMAWRFRELNRQLASVTNESLKVLIAAVEARDPYTKDHSVKVAGLSRHIAETLDLPGRQVQVIHSAALLHDIGKIGVPDAVLTKPGRLTDEERALIWQHPAIGTKILQQTHFFTAELPLIRHHHEWYDGTGYPDRIKGQDIPIGSRIIQISDAVEAMFASRSYKQPQSVEHVVNELRQGAGKQFDPSLTEPVVALIEQGMLDQLWHGDHINRQLVALSTK